jgi:hypothetical protein
MMLGWSYAVNFGSIDDNSSGTRKMIHFVRRRRLERNQIFDGNSTLN